MSKISNYNGKDVFYNQEIALNYLQKIQNFLKKHLKKAKAKGFVVGISSGIDSSLVYAIAKSVAPETTLGVVMPIVNMTKEDLNHIKLLEAQFNDRFQRVDLTNSFNALTNELKLKNLLAVSNIKPRLRMSTLYALAQENNYLVLGTDNADETYIGYFTKFGDGGADLLPISNLTKGEVKYLASLLNIPKEIITKDPSAGLWQGQTDELELGFSYGDLDFYLNHLHDLKALKKYLSQETIAKIEYKHKISQHKRDKIYTVKNLK